MRVALVFFIVNFFHVSWSQEYFKDTLHCGCIYELLSTSKDVLGDTVYIGKVIVDVNGDFVDYGPGFSGIEAFYSAVPTSLPSIKKLPVLSKPTPPPSKSDTLWQSYSFGESTLLIHH